MIPTDSEERKNAPVFSGCMAYFPDALIEIAKLSRAGNDKHNPGQPLHWSRDKSSDHVDCIARHLLEYDSKDKDGFFHATMVAWRALAALQLILVQEEEYKMTDSNLERWYPDQKKKVDDKGLIPYTAEENAVGVVDHLMKEVPW